MKGIQKGISMIVVLTFILLSGLGVLLAPPVDAWYESTAEDAYVFPIDPGAARECWKGPASHRERVAVCRLPQEILENISTEGLVETCFKYPVLDNFTFYSSPYEGFIKTRKEFNGLRELFDRPDAGQALLAFYDGIDLNKMRKCCPQADLRYAYIEMALAEEALLKKMSPTERRDLLSAAMGKHFKGDFADLFSTTGFSKALLVARILAMDSERFGDMLNKDAKLKSFVMDGNLFAVTSGDWNRHVCTITGIAQAMSG